MEKVVVLLPVYKNDNPIWFKQSIESVLNQQSCEPHVLIGVDGPIEDGLEVILNEYSENNNVTVVRFPNNRGLACVLNDLIEIAICRGYEYFARMDADDVSLPNRFIDQIEFLCKNPDIDVVGSNIEEMSSNSIPTGKIIHYPESNEDCFKHFRYRDPLAHPAVMFRLSFFNKVKGYRPEFRKNQDTMIWFDGFLKGCRFSNLNKVLLYFRVTDDFYNRRNGLKRAKSMLLNRFKINRQLKYDISADIFAILMFLMTISPTFIRKILYKIRS